jgi:flagellar biosynthetic protein FliR
MISISLDQLNALISQFFWPFVRILGMIMVAPSLGDRSVPARVKIALAALIAIVAIPVLPPHPVVTLDSYAGFALVAHETLIGISLGFAVRIVFAAIETGGELVGLQMGFSFAGYFDPGSGGETNAISSYLGTLATLLFLAINGHLLMIYGVIESFHRLPIELADGSLLTIKHVLAMGSDLFAIALSIALPFIVLLLVINLGMGVMSRVAPQLNVFALGFPITLTVGMTALALILPYLERPLTHALERSVAMMLAG